MPPSTSPASLRSRPRMPWCRGYLSRTAETVLMTTVDGLNDCDDPDCFSKNCQEICDDGKDNDGDGFVDCADTDCEPCREICNNGLDDDRDRLVDCDDPDCAGKAICTCKPSKVAVEPTQLNMKKGKKGKITLVVTGKEDGPAEGQKIAVKISKAGKNRISVSPMNVAINENGKAIFTVIAKNKTGSARIFFNIGGVRISIPPVKIIK